MQTQGTSVSRSCGTLGGSAISSRSTLASKSARQSAARCCASGTASLRQRPLPEFLSVAQLHSGRARWSRASRGMGVRMLAIASSAAVPVLPPSVAASADKYRFTLSNGAMVYAAVEPREQELIVTVSVPAEGLQEGTEPQLQWGMYRTLDAVWQFPSELVPKGSQRHEGSGSMRSPLGYDKRRDVWELQLKVRRRMTPVQLAFALHLPDTGITLTPLRGGYCVVPVGMGTGNPEPLGPSLVAVTSGAGPEATCTLNFAVFSRHASSMSLAILRRDGAGYLEVALDPATHRTGDVWHVELQGLRNVGGLCYGWRASGDKTWADGGSFHPAYIMLDPYCPRALPVTLPQAAYDAAPLLPPQGRLPGPVLLGSPSHLTEAFDWGMSPAPGPRRSLEESVLLELDVADFTAGPSAERLVPLDHRGTYLGVIDRLPDIVASGATAVVLSNVFLSSLTAAPPHDPDEEEGASVAWPSTGGQLRRPLSFMAPEVALVAGPDPAAAAPQLKAVVAALHGAGLEVLLEAEFCLTAEVAGGAGGRLQSMAGLDGDMYVRGGGGPGARGVLNTGQPVVRQLVRSALRHWVSEFRVDGFVLVNAENLAQDPLGAVRDSPPLLEELAADPVLRDAKIIASGNDGGLLPRGGERGVPHYGVLAEWNGRFARDIIALLRDNAGGRLSALATRLMGSPDLTAARWDAGLPGGLAAGRRPGYSVNALSAPGGPALLSLAGGDEDLERGEVVARSLLVAAAVAQGTPALSGSVLARAGLRRFAAAALQLRRKYRHLLAPPLLDSPRDITWHDVSASCEPDWSGEAAAAQVFASNYIGFSARGLAPEVAAAIAAAAAKATPSATSAAASPASSTVTRGTVAAAAATASHSQQQAVYVGFNPNPEAVTVTLPTPPSGLQWRRVIDTSRLPPDDVVPEGGELLDTEYILAPGAALMLDAVIRPTQPLTSGPGGVSAALRASQVYERLGQP